jgi:SnoaL-like domain
MTGGYPTTLSTMHPFRAAVEAGDFAALPAMFSEDVVFRSPIAHKPYQGREMLAVILRAVSRVFEDLRYDREIGGADDADHALMFTARVGDLDINGCDFLHTGPDGLIDEFTVMLRPLKAVNAFADKMAVEFASAMESARK